MLHPTGRLARAVPPDQEAERNRVARVFAAECAKAALEVFERHRPRDPHPCAALAAARSARGEGGSFAPGMFLRLLVASPHPSDDRRSPGRSAHRGRPGLEPSSPLDVGRSTALTSWEARADLCIPDREHQPTGHESPLDRASPAAGDPAAV